jgi:hypothetical protein
MNAQDLLARLQDASPQGPLDRLATLIVEHELSQPLETLVPPALLTRALIAALQGWLDSDSADRELTSTLELLSAHLNREPGTLRDQLPKELSKLLLDLATRHYSPDRTVVLTLLDRPPVRALARGLLLDVLIEFSRKVSAPVTENRIAKGLSGLARFATEQARGSGGTLGGLASALSDELERQVEKRARDFADSALSGILQQLADALSDPGRSMEQAEMRVALLDGVLNLPLERLGHELSRLDVPGAAQVLRKALSKWLASPEGPPQLEAAIARGLKASGQRPVREVLGSLGLLESFQTHGRESVRGRLAPLAASEPFARWLEELMHERSS